MTRDEAIAEIHNWLERCDATRARAVALQKVAAAARAGDLKRAERMLENAPLPKVYDAELLEPAVRMLLKEIEG